MKVEDLNKLKVEVTQDILRSFLSKVITTQERIISLTKRYEDISKKSKKDLTEEDKKLIREYEADITAFKEGVAEAEIHIENFRLLGESYSSNKPIKV
jgi:hypothetical protein